MYRPTVRYHDDYRKYVDQVFRVTSLDRNQIIRLALFTAAHDQEFQKKLEEHKRKDVPTSLPHPLWSLSTDRLWLEQSPTEEKGGKDVNDDRLHQETKTRIDARAYGNGRNEGTANKSQPRRVGSICTERGPGGDDVIRINFR